MHDEHMPEYAPTSSVRAVGVVVLLAVVFFTISLWITAKRIAAVEHAFDQYKMATDHNLGIVVSVINNQGVQLSNIVARATNNIEKK